MTAIRFGKVIAFNLRDTDAEKLNLARNTLVHRLAMKAFTSFGTMDYAMVDLQRFMVVTNQDHDEYKRRITATAPENPVGVLREMGRRTDMEQHDVFYHQNALGGDGITTVCTTKDSSPRTYFSV